MRRLFIAIASICATLLVGQANAEVQSIPMPGDSKLVVFNYDANNTYTVLARPKSVTNIALHSGENIVALAVGDTTQWVVTKTAGHVFIKPIHPDIATTATLVTDQRTYQLTLRSSPENGKFYQRVSWTYPDILIFEQQQRQVVQQRSDAERARLDATIASPGVNIEKLNWEYEVKGESAFKPTQVFDDGKFTWILMPKVQEMPALFMISEETSKGELLNYTMRGQYLVVHRLVQEVMLKLGEKEIRIVNKTLKKSSGFSFFR